jgi:prepilin-type N-terminal cleavage/methylation domain-containing protein
MMIKSNMRNDGQSYANFRCQGRRGTGGWSLVELIVVMAIVAVLLCVVVVAVQGAREASRKTVCQNHLRQIGLAVQSHVTSRQYFPTNGWGWRLIPDAQLHQRGGQAGGWLFQLLPYVELKSLHDLGVFSQTPAVTLERKHRLLRTPVAIFNCPSRSVPTFIPQRRVPGFYVNLPEPPELVASADYAVNGGTFSIFPQNHPSGDGVTQMDKPYLDAFPWPAHDQSNGVSFLHGRFRPADILRGSSNVLWAAERYIRFDWETEFDDGGNDQSMYSGQCSDTIRFTGRPPISNRNLGVRTQFGSSHSAEVVGVMLDGSVQGFAFEIDESVFRAVGRRHDTPLPYLN